LKKNHRRVPKARTAQGSSQGANASVGGAGAPGFVENPTAEDYTTAAEFGLRSGDLALARTQIAAALTFDPLEAGRLALADRILVASGAASRAAGSSFFGDIALRARALARVARFCEAFSLLVQAVEFRDDVPYLEWVRAFPADALDLPSELDDAVFASLSRWLVRLPVSGETRAPGTVANLAVTAEILARWASPLPAPSTSERGRGRGPGPGPGRRAGLPAGARTPARRRRDAAVLFAVLQRRLGNVLDERGPELLRACFAEEPTSLVAGELARVWQARGDFAEAARWFGEAATLEPGAVEYQLDRANAEMRSGDWAEARASYAAIVKQQDDPWAAVDLAYLDARLSVDARVSGSGSDFDAAESRLAALARNVVLDEAVRRRASLLLADARAFVRDFPVPTDPLTQIAFARLRAAAMDPVRGPETEAAASPPAVEVRIESEDDAPLSLRLAFALGLSAWGRTGALAVSVADPTRRRLSRWFDCADERAVPRSTLAEPSPAARAWLTEVVKVGDDIPALAHAVKQAASRAGDENGILAAALDPPVPPRARHPLRWVLSHELAAALLLVVRAPAHEPSVGLWRGMFDDGDAWLQTAAFVALSTGRAAGWDVAALDQELAKAPVAQPTSSPSSFLEEARRQSDLRLPGLSIEQRRALQKRHLDELFRRLPD
jgi:tetratricopeptide (TPR) repeat protein